MICHIRIALLHWLKKIQDFEPHPITHLSSNCNPLPKKGRQGSMPSYLIATIIYSNLKQGLLRENHKREVSMCIYSKWFIHCVTMYLIEIKIVDSNTGQASLSSLSLNTLKLKPCKLYIMRKISGNIQQVSGLFSFCQHIYISNSSGSCIYRSLSLVF